MTELTRTAAAPSPELGRPVAPVSAMSFTSINVPRLKSGKLPSRSVALTVCIFSLGIGLASIGGLWDSLSASGATTADASEIPATVIQTFDPVQPTRDPILRASVLNAAVTDSSTAEDGLAAAPQRDSVNVPIPSPVVQRIRNVAIEDRAPVPVTIQPRSIAVTNQNSRVAPQATTGRAGQETMAAASRPKLILDLTVAADETASVAFPLQIEGSDATATGGHLTIHGLPEHATLSRGKLVERGVWRAPVAGARDLILSLPPLTPGDFEVLLELRSADGRLMTSGLSVVRVVPRPRSMTTTAMAPPIGHARRTVSDVAPLAVAPSAPAPMAEAPMTSGLATSQLGPDAVLAPRKKTPVPMRTARAFGPPSGLGGPGHPGGPLTGGGPARTPDRGFGVFDQRKGI